MDPVKRARLERTWAHRYRSHALPLIDEERFAKYFDPENGRPNKSVRLVVSVLVLNEVFDLTDTEAPESPGSWTSAGRKSQRRLPRPRSCGGPASCPPRVHPVAAGATAPRSSTSRPGSV
jgi:hypothetical protein